MKVHIARAINSVMPACVYSWDAMIWKTTLDKSAVTCKKCLRIMAQEKGK